MTVEETLRDMVETPLFDQHRALEGVVNDFLASQGFEPFAFGHYREKMYTLILKQYMLMGTMMPPEEFDEAAPELVRELLPSYGTWLRSLVTPSIEHYMASLDEEQGGLAQGMMFRTNIPRVTLMDTEIHRYNRRHPLHIDGTRAVLLSKDAYPIHQDERLQVQQDYVGRAGLLGYRDPVWDPSMGRILDRLDGNVIDENVQPEIPCVDRLVERTHPVTKQTEAYRVELRLYEDEAFYTLVSRDRPQLHRQLVAAIQADLGNTYPLEPECNIMALTESILDHARYEAS